MNFLSGTLQDCFEFDFKAFVDRNLISRKSSQNRFNRFKKSKPAGFVIYFINSINASYIKWSRWLGRECCVGSFLDIFDGAESKTGQTGRTVGEGRGRGRGWGVNMVSGVREGVEGSESSNRWNSRSGGWDGSQGEARGISKEVHSPQEVVHSSSSSEEKWLRSWG